MAGLNGHRNNELGLCRLAALAEGILLIEQKAHERRLILWNHLWPRCDKCRTGHKCKACTERDKRVIGFDGKALVDFVVAKGDAIYQCQHPPSQLRMERTSPELIAMSA